MESLFVLYQYDRGNQSIKKYGNFKGTNSINFLQNKQTIYKVYG